MIWQEKVTPIIAVELLSPGTEKEDLGETERGINQPPTKWEYERILKIPYYVVFDRYRDRFRAFQRDGGSYHELVGENKLWLPQVQLGIGLWVRNVSMVALV